MNLTDSVLDALESVVLFLIGLLPDSVPDWFDPGIVTEGFQALMEYAAPVGLWLPLGLLGGVVISVVVVWFSMSAVQLAMKIYAMIRGGAS